MTTDLPVSDMRPKRVCLSRYGLLASVLADARSDFDQFLTFYNHFENEQGLMCWQQVCIGNDISLMLLSIVRRALYILPDSPFAAGCLLSVECAI